MSEKLTVLIPCKNESQNIRDCIESARPVADEILVADSLSTDDTLEIVRGLGGCRIIEREFVDYANFKNWAIPQAAHPWVLVLDADERVTETLAAEIRETLAHDNPALDAYHMRRDNFFLGRQIRHCGWNRSTIIRLFRRDACRYGPARVHEQLDVRSDRVGTLHGKLLHYTCSNGKAITQNTAPTSNFLRSVRNASNRQNVHSTSGIKRNKPSIRVSAANVIVAPATKKYL